MKVHLVDGTYELFRAYYGSPEGQAADGTEVGAVRGLMRSMLALLGERDVSHVAVAFDHTVESFRNDLYDGYKTGEEMDPDLFAQFPLAEEATRALGLVTWPMVEFEADDGLATGVALYCDRPGVEQTVICSPDKDMTQCVQGSRVVCRDRLRGKTLDDSGVIEKFGVKPTSIPDWLALVGDSADGFPGIPRWGAKSAATVLAVYERLEQIPDDPASWSVKVRGAQTLARNLQAQREDAELFRTLATLRTDAPITEDLADLRWQGPDEAGLKQFAERLGDRQVFDRARAVAD